MATVSEMTIRGNVRKIMDATARKEMANLKLDISQNIDMRYLVEDSPISTSTEWTKFTGFNYDPKRKTYVTIKNTSGSAGYFRPAIYRNDIAASIRANQLIEPGAGYTWELPTINDDGIHGGWFPAANDYTDYSWYIYTQNTNGRSAVVSIYGYNDDKEFIKEYNTIIVSPDGKRGSFKRIDDAIAYAKSKFNVLTEPVTIFIKNGKYEIDPVASRAAVLNKGANRISIIGEDRDNVEIVLTCTPAYNNKVLEAGGPCMIANLTIKNLWNDDGSTYDGGVHNPYCIHNDANFETSENYTTAIVNCVLYSELMSPIGAGLRKRQKQVYENCLFIFDSKKASFAGNGSLYVHTPDQQVTADGIELEIENCTAISKNQTPAVFLPFGPTQNGNLSYADIPIHTRRNIAITNGNSATNVDSRYDLQWDSEMNNIDALNYSHYNP